MRVSEASTKVPCCSGTRTGIPWDPHHRPTAPKGFPAPKISDSKPSHWELPYAILFLSLNNFNLPVFSSILQYPFIIYPFFGGWVLHSTKKSSVSRSSTPPTTPWASARMAVARRAARGRRRCWRSSGPPAIGIWGAGSWGLGVDVDSCGMWNPMFWGGLNQSEWIVENQCGNVGIETRKHGWTVFVKHLCFRFCTGRSREDYIRPVGHGIVRRDGKTHQADK